jgi:hypothetical protein
LAVIDIASATITKIYPLGLKDNSKPGNGLDVNDRDNKIDIRTFENVVSLFMPDTIAYYEEKGACNKINGRYILTANEGDSREYKAFKDEDRVNKITLNSTLFNANDTAALQRMSISLEDGFSLDANNKRVYNKLHAFGARSFSIVDATTGVMIYDSGDEIERITAEMYPKYFNSDHSSVVFDGRSSKKGPEPEVVQVGRINNVPVAFIGLERLSGVMLYDLTDITKPKFLQYVNPRNFTETDIKKQGDLGPEGFQFVSDEESPTGNPLLLVGNEVSGSTAIFELTC